MYLCEILPTDWDEVSIGDSHFADLLLQLVCICAEGGVFGESGVLRREVAVDDIVDVG